MGSSESSANDTVTTLEKKKITREELIHLLPERIAKYIILIEQAVEKEDTKALLGVIEQLFQSLSKSQTNKIVDIIRLIESGIENITSPDNLRTSRNSIMLTIALLISFFSFVIHDKPEEVGDENTAGSLRDLKRKLEKKKCTVAGGDLLPTIVFVTLVFLADIFHLMPSSLTTEESSGSETCQSLQTKLKNARSDILSALRLGDANKAKQLAATIIELKQQLDKMGCTETISITSIVEDIKKIKESKVSINILIFFGMIEDLSSATSVDILDSLQALIPVFKSVPATMNVLQALEGRLVMANVKKQPEIIIILLILILISRLNTEALSLEKHHLTIELNHLHAEFVKLLQSEEPNIESIVEIGSLFVDQIVLARKAKYPGTISSQQLQTYITSLRELKSPLLDGVIAGLSHEAQYLSQGDISLEEFQNVFWNNLNRALKLENNASGTGLGIIANIIMADGSLNMIAGTAADNPRKFLRETLLLDENNFTLSSKFNLELSLPLREIAAIQLFFVGVGETRPAHLRMVLSSLTGLLSLTSFKQSSNPLYDEILGDIKSKKLAININGQPVYYFHDSAPTNLTSNVPVDNTLIIEYQSAASVASLPAVIKGVLNPLTGQANYVPTNPIEIGTIIIMQNVKAVTTPILPSKPSKKCIIM